MSKRKRLYYTYLNSSDWRTKREAAFAMHGRRCGKCGSVHNLCVHHRRYSKQLENVKIEWLEVMCRECHEEHHRQAAKARRERRRARSLVELLMFFGDDDVGQVAL